MSCKEAAIKLRIKHPEWTLREIGNSLKVTPQRISKVLQEENLPRRGIKSKPPALCKTCGYPTSGAKLHPGKCREKYYYSEVKCHNCGTVKRMRTLMVGQLFKRQRYFYCTRECYYAGKRAGWS